MLTLKNNQRMQIMSKQLEISEKERVMLAL